MIEHQIFKEYNNKHQVDNLFNMLLTLIKPGC